MITIQDISDKTKEVYQHSICLGCPEAFELYPGLIGCDVANYPSTRRRRCKFAPDALQSTPAVSRYPTTGNGSLGQCRGSQRKVFTLNFLTGANGCNRP